MYLTNNGPNGPKTEPKMPYICCFCVYDCAGMDTEKLDENQAKSDKTGHENGKSTKSAEAGEGILLMDHI